MENNRNCFKQEKTLQDVLNEITKVCSCTCRMRFYSYSPDVLICRWCGKKVYRNKQAEFKEKLKQKMKEG